MRLLPSGEALTFLSQSAPRPWIKRMLKWMIFDAEISPFFTQGFIRPFKRISFLIRDDGEVDTRSSATFEKTVRDTFNSEAAAMVLESGDMDPIYDQPVQWSVEDQPVEVSAGFFVFSDEIDWDLGTLRTELSDRVVSDGDLFWDADRLLTSSMFENPDFEVELSGLCFPIDVIEMLLPEKGVLSNNKVQFAGGRITGRPPKWDWEGAISHVAALANLPDGLPVGPGAQAQIERMIADWFIKESSDAPATSQIRTRAQSILRSIEKSKI